jgi:hypothetical protein
MKESKEPFVGAILNFFFPGAGYLYAGRRRLFGGLLLGGYGIALLGVVFYIVSIAQDPQFLSASSEDPALTPLDVIGLMFAYISPVVVAVAFAIDGYNETKHGKKAK